MERVRFGELSLWQFENLAKEKSIRHFVTERTAIGTGEFTLSLSSSPDKEFVRANRKKLASAMGVAPENLFMPSQVHKTRIVQVSSSTSKDELIDTDALITAQKGLCIAVMSADCVPILLYDKKHHACAAIQSGWKGTVAKILEKTLQTMNHTFGTIGENVIAGIGPSASQVSYEVGEEVITAVRAAYSNAGELMIAKSNNKAMLDLWAANKCQLLDFGVPESQIETSNLCTIINNQYFFSARKGDSGRFAAGIVLN